MTENLLLRIASKKEELIDLTQALVRVPSVNPPGQAYQDCAQLIGERLAGRGLEVSYLRASGALADSDRYPRINVIARHEGKRPGPTVHFNGHIDVVEPGHGWTVDPFAAVVKDGKVFGRGTCDMKAGLAAAIIAVEAILEEGLALAGNLEISGTVDEETGGFAGVAHLAREGRFTAKSIDHVIIPEPLDYDQICLGHRGAWWAEIETKGRIAHGSMPFLGDCAVRHMGAFLEVLERRVYPALQERSTEMPVIPMAARRSTLNINSLHGGLCEDHEGPPSPLVPDRCRLVIDRRFLIEETLESVKGEILSVLESLKQERPGFAYEIRDIMAFEPIMTDSNATVVKALEGSIARVLDRPARHVASPGTYDHKHFTRVGGIRDCVAYGPGRLELAHQPDEFVVIDEMVQASQVMALAACRLLAGMDA